MSDPNKPEQDVLGLVSSGPRSEFTKSVGQVNFCSDEVALTALSDAIEGMRAGKNATALAQTLRPLILMNREGALPPDNPLRLDIGNAILDLLPKVKRENETAGPAIVFDLATDVRRSVQLGGSLHSREDGKGALLFDRADQVVRANGVSNPKLTTPAAKSGAKGEMAPQT